MGSQVMRATYSKGFCLGLRLLYCPLSTHGLEEPRWALPVGGLSYTQRPPPAIAALSADAYDSRLHGGTSCWLQRLCLEHSHPQPASSAWWAGLDGPAFFCAVCEDGAKVILKPPSRCAGEVGITLTTSARGLLAFGWRRAVPITWGRMAASEVGSDHTFHIK